MSVAACLVLTTVGSSFDAASLARDLVEQNLCACVNVVSNLQSIYRWKSAVEEENEQLLIIKTVEENVEALRGALMAMHPYEVPEFVVVKIDSIGEAYGRWLAEST